MEKEDRVICKQESGQEHEQGQARSEGAWSVERGASKQTSWFSKPNSLRFVRSHNAMGHDESKRAYRAKADKKQQQKPPQNKKKT